MNSRLTFHSPDGSWGLNNGYDMKKVPSELYGALWKLKDYEDTGLQPDQIEQMNDLYLDKCEEVNELEKQLEELHRTAGQRSDWLPCSERLPEENEVVILTFRNGAGLHVGEATYKKKCFSMSQILGLVIMRKFIKVQSHGSHCRNHMEERNYEQRNII